MFVGHTSQDAREAFYPYYSKYFKRIPQFAIGMPRATYDEWARSGLLVSSPQEVIDQIMLRHEVLGISRYVDQFDVGPMPVAMANESLERFATEVASVLRKETQDRVTSSGALMRAGRSAGPIAVLGARKSGTVLAKPALEGGYDVYIAGSAEPGRISMLIDVIAPGAVPTTAADAARRADLVVLAVPWRASTPCRHVRYTARPSSTQ